MYWDKKIEFINKSDLEKYQLKYLNAILQQAKKTKFYNKKLIKFKKINSYSNINDIPFTYKTDLRKNFPFGLLACNKNDIIRLHSSSGTTGNPTVVLYTQNDINAWADLMARCMYMVGLRCTDVFQNIMGYGLFTGGLGFHYGAERIGCLTIPIGPASTEKQLWFMKELKTTAVHILPSYALRIYSFLEKMKINIHKDLSLKMAFIGAEPHSAEIRDKIENLYNINAYNCYGLSEMNGPGVAFECKNKNGLHLWEDHFYMEIIDPKSNKILKEGETGELVLTTLKREGMPLIRYRTGDLTRILIGKCKCGRTHRRIERIKGRVDDMLIINGVNIFPNEIESVLMSIIEIGNNYYIEIKKKGYLDKIYIKSEVLHDIYIADKSKAEKLKKHITLKLINEITVSPKVMLYKKGSLPVTQGKALRIRDLR